jgi:hypothetical protein
MSTYSRGVTFERKVATQLRGCGYSVQRSPMSRGPADLIAEKTATFPTTVQHGSWHMTTIPPQITVTDKLLIQCKHTSRAATCSDSRRGYLTVTEWNSLWDAAQQAGARPLVAFNRGKHTVFMELMGRKSGQRRKQPWMEVEVEVKCESCRGAENFELGKP